MDIVERLRTVVNIGNGTITPLRIEAAAEIERLRKALQFAHNNLEGLVRDAYAVYANIQAALKEKE